MYNKMSLNFLSQSQNESLARNVVASFLLPLNPTVSELNDIKTAVSEAVTNAVVHGYPNEQGTIELNAEITDNSIHIEIKDYGVGIENLSKALETFYTTKESEERSGIGFTIMKSFMDSVEVISQKGVGTTVKMTKILNV